MDCSLPGSCVHGISQARILDRVAISSSSGSSRPRDQTCIFCISYIGNWILYNWATWDDQLINSVAQSCPTLCDPMDCSMPGLPVQHQLPEFTKTHVHWVGDAIQPSLTLSSPSPLPSIFPSIRVMCQLFPSGGQSSRASASTSVLPINIQDWFPLGLTVWISLQSKGLSRVFSNTTFKSFDLLRSAFFIVQLSHPYMTIGKTIA